MCFFIGSFDETALPRSVILFCDCGFKSDSCAPGRSPLFSSSEVIEDMQWFVIALKFNLPTEGHCKL